MEELSKLRREIDLIDEEIIKLLNKRAELAKAIGEIKKSSSWRFILQKGRGRL